MKVASFKRKLLQLPKTDEIEQIMRDTRTLEWFIETEKLINRVKRIKADFAIVIDLLNIDAFNTFDISNPRSLTDFAILMALYYLQMHMIERIVSGESRFSKRVESYINNDQWQKFERDTYDGFNPKVAKILELLEDFDNKQREFTDDIYTQEFADEHRKGIRVISGGILQQFKFYIKGLYFQTAKQ